MTYLKLTFTMKILSRFAAAPLVYIQYTDKFTYRQIVLALATCSTLLVFAQSTIPSSTFVYSGDFTGSSNLTFAVNLAQDSQDMFIYLSGPSSASWLAIGTGSEMKDSLIFIVYSSTDDKSLCSYSLRYSETD